MVREETREEPLTYEALYKVRGNQIPVPSVVLKPFIEMKRIRKCLNNKVCFRCDTFKECLGDLSEIL